MLTPGDGEGFERDTRLSDSQQADGRPHALTLSLVKVSVSSYPIHNKARVGGVCVCVCLCVGSGKESLLERWEAFVEALVYCGKGVYWGNICVLGKWCILRLYVC